MLVLAPLDPSKRAVAMERVAASLRYGARWPSDGDVDAAIKAALAGLLHGSAA
jgi:hypothetical protein